MVAALGTSPSPSPKVTHRLERLEDPPGTNTYEQGASPGLGFHVTAECPSCRHLTTDLFVLAAVSSGDSLVTGLVSSAAGWLATELASSIKALSVTPVGLPGGPASPPPTPTVGMIRCRCAGLPDGDGTVADTLGCGSRWLLAYDPESRQLTAVPAAEQSVYWAGAELVGSSAGRAGTVVRDVATKWQGAITALLALGAVGATLSRETVQGLSTGVRTGVGALVLTAFALFRASVAASGIPRVGSTSVDDVAASDLAPLRQAVHGARSLATALLSALLAIVFGAATIGLLVFAPPADAPALVRVTWAEGSTTTTDCGTLTLADGSAHLEPRADGSPARGFPQTSIVSVASC